VTVADPGLPTSPIAISEKAVEKGTAMMPPKPGTPLIGMSATMRGVVNIIAAAIAPNTAIYTKSLVVK